MSGDPGDLLRLAEAAGAALRSAGKSAAVAESCTGGWLMEALTGVPGSSAYFVGGVVSYADSAKVELLGVSPELLQRHGAVSGAVARAMASGVRARLGADVGVAITGIAGPEGGTAEKPIGTVWFALAGPEGERVERVLLRGDRRAIRAAAVAKALEFLRLVASAERSGSSDPGEPRTDERTPADPPG